jgi:hypothetical protein
MVRSQHRQIVCETLSQKKKQPMAGGVAQGEDPKFRSYNSQKKEKKKSDLEVIDQAALLF